MGVACEANGASSYLLSAEHEARIANIFATALCYTCKMSTTAVSTDRSLRALKNISWLTRRQMHRLAGALTLQPLRQGKHYF